MSKEQISVIPVIPPAPAHKIPADVERSPNGWLPLTNECRPALGVKALFIAIDGYGLPRITIATLYSITESDKGFSFDIRDPDDYEPNCKYWQHLPEIDVP